MNKYEKVEEMRKQGVTVKDACAKAKVAVSGFYSWRARQKKGKRQKKQPQMVTLNLPEDTKEILIIRGPADAVVAALDKLSQMK